MRGLGGRVQPRAESYMVGRVRTAAPPTPIFGPVLKNRVNFRYLTARITLAPLGKIVQQSSLLISSHVLETCPIDAGPSALQRTIPSVRLRNRTTKSECTLLANTGSVRVGSTIFTAGLSGNISWAAIVLFIFLSFTKRLVGPTGTRPSFLPLMRRVLIQRFKLRANHTHICSRFKKQGKFFVIYDLFNEFFVISQRKRL